MRATLRADTACGVLRSSLVRSPKVAVRERASPRLDEAPHPAAGASVETADLLSRCALLVIDVQRGFDAPVYDHRRNNSDCEENMTT